MLLTLGMSNVGGAFFGVVGMALALVVALALSLLLSVGLFYLACLFSGRGCPNFFKVTGLVALSTVICLPINAIVYGFIFVCVLFLHAFFNLDNDSMQGLAIGGYIVFYLCAFLAIVGVSGRVYNWGLRIEDGPNIALLQYGMPALFSVCLFCFGFMLATIANRNGGGNVAFRNPFNSQSTSPGGSSTSGPPRGSTLGANPGGSVPGGGTSSGSPGGMPAAAPGNGGFPGSAGPLVGPGQAPGGFPGGNTPVPGGGFPPGGIPQGPGAAPGGVPGGPGGVPRGPGVPGGGVPGGGLTGGIPTGSPPGVAETGPTGLPPTVGSDEPPLGGAGGLGAPSRAAAVTLAEKANRAFEENRVSDGFQFLYGNALVEDDLRGVRWSNKLKQPRLAIHFGIGVAGKGLDSVPIDFGVPGKSGPDFGGGAGLPGAGRPGAGQGAGGPGAGGLGGGFPGGPAGGDRGVPGVAPGGAGGFAPPGPPGAGAPGGGGAGNAGAGNAGGIGAEGTRQEDGTAGIAAKIARHLRQKTARAGVGKENLHIISVLNTDETVEGLLAKAREKGVDALVVLNVTTKLVGLSRQRDNSIAVVIYNVATGEVTGRTKTLSERQWLTERNKGRDRAAELATEATGLIDKDWDLIRAPAISADEARSRAGKIVDNRTQPLLGAVELRYYQSQSLLPAEEVRRHLNSLVGEEDAQTLLSGAKADRKKVVESFLPTIE